MAEISLELIGRCLDAIQTELREFKFGVDADRRDAASWRTNLITEVAAKLAAFELRIDDRLAQLDGRLESMASALGVFAAGGGRPGEGRHPGGFVRGPRRARDAGEPAGAGADAGGGGRRRR